MSKETLFFVGEESVRPLDRRPQRLLTGVGVSTSFEQVQSLGKPLEQLLGREQRRPCSSQLERQRQLVQPPAQLAHGGCPAETDPLLGGARQEEVDRVLGVQRRHLVDMLALKLQPLTAGHEY